MIIDIGMIRNTSVMDIQGPRAVLKVVTPTALMRPVQVLQLLDDIERAGCEPEFWGTDFVVVRRNFDYERSRR